MLRMTILWCRSLLEIWSSTTEQIHSSMIFRWESRIIRYSGYVRSWKFTAQRLLFQLEDDDDVVKLPQKMLVSRPGMPPPPPRPSKLASPLRALLEREQKYDDDPEILMTPRRLASMSDIQWVFETSAPLIFFENSRYIKEEESETECEQRRGEHVVCNTVIILLSVILCW